MARLGRAQPFKPRYGYPPAVAIPQPSAPTVTTQAVSAITATTATGNGTVVSENGANTTQRGVCWNTTGTPTTADNTATSAGTLGAFTASMTGLVASTGYFVRAYAINSAGTAYGSQVTFSTTAATGVQFFIQQRTLVGGMQELGF